MPSLRTAAIVSITFGLISALSTPASAATQDRQRWVSRYDGPGHASDYGGRILVSPDGGSIFAVGVSRGDKGLYDWLTIAYDRATGAPRWIDRYDGPGGGSDVTMDAGLSPDGST